MSSSFFIIVIITIIIIIVIIIIICTIHSFDNISYVFRFIESFAIQSNTWKSSLRCTVLLMTLAAASYTHMHTEYYLCRIIAQLELE